MVNSKDLLELRSFIKALFNKCIEAGSLSLPILRYNIKVIKKAINKAAGPNIKDLHLSDVIIVKGFHVNIISEPCLNKIGV